jgi:hypothetical protein
VNLVIRDALFTQIKEHSLNLTLPAMKDECADQLKTHWVALVSMEKNSLELRHAKMEATSNVKSGSGRKSKKKHRDALQATEAHAAMYRKVKAVCGKFSKSVFTSIEVPTSWPNAHTTTDNLQDLPDLKKATSWKTIDLPDEIVYYLLTQNRLHFGQAGGTPFTTPQFTRAIDWQASMDSAELILHGEYTSAELTDLQELLLKHCQSPELDALSPLITEDEFISKFKTWNERTSTSPSGLHLGHYKILVARNDADLTTDEGRELENQQRELIRAHTAMLNYSLHHSYAFKHCKNVVNVMIEKKSKGILRFIAFA